MWRRIRALSPQVAVLGTMMMIACEPADPCGDYVDYMCLCHADDEDVDCDGLKVTYASADPDVQDECAILLDTQQKADDEAGLECAF